MNSWAQGARLPSADALVAILRAFPDLSFDRIAREDQAADPLDDHEERIKTLEVLVAQLITGEQPGAVESGGGKEE